MPGSVGNPVILDPFTRIVSVHWRTARYLTVSIPVINAGNTFADEYSLAEPISSTPVHSWLYIESVRIEVSVDSIEAWERVGSDEDYSWRQIGAEQVAVSGFPFESQEPTFGAWEWARNVGFGVFNPRLVHEPGSSLGASPMLSPDDVPFDRGLDPSLKIEGCAFTGSFFRVAFNPHSDGSTPRAKSVDLTAAEMASYPFSVAGVTATYRGRTYSPLRTAIPNTPGMIVVLLERDDPTA